MDQDVTKKPMSSEQSRDGLTDEADGNTQADHHTQGKNGTESMRSADNDVKVHTQGEKQLKREKRKQANRESARRSRMRKQAEYEELVKSCHSLSTEQMDLKSELDQLKADAKKLRLENTALREQLKYAQVMQEGGIASAKTEVGFALPNGAKDILNNLGSVSGNDQLDRETHETSTSETITRLHQMLESSSRTDAVAAR